MASDKVTLNIFNLNRFKNYFDVLRELDSICVRLGGHRNVCGSYQEMFTNYFDKAIPSNIYNYVFSNLSKLDSYDLKYAKSILDLYINAKDYLNLCMVFVKDRFKHYDKDLKDTSFTLMNSLKEIQYSRENIEVFNDSEEYKQSSLKEFSKINLLINDKNFECSDFIINLKYDFVDLYNAATSYFKDLYFYENKMDLNTNLPNIKLINIIGAKILNIKFSPLEVLYNKQCKSLFSEFFNRAKSDAKYLGIVNKSLTNSKIDGLSLILSDWVPRLCTECNYDQINLQKDLLSILKYVKFVNHQVNTIKEKEYKL